MEKKIRVLIAKAGCDIHERGALTMISAFRDAGMEVIYTGRYQSESAIANVAVMEDVDVIGVSDLTGGLPIICGKLLTELERQGADIPVFCGGLLTDADVERLLEMGVKACYGPGSSIPECVDKVRSIVEEKVCQDTRPPH